jgi:hypothetical protein
MLSKLLRATFPSRREGGLAGWTIGRKARHGGDAPPLSRCSGRGEKARWKLQDEVNVLALIKGQEHYIFVYDDASRPQLIDNFRDLAANPEVNLSWFDAMVLTTKARPRFSDS